MKPRDREARNGGRPSRATHSPAGLTAGLLVPIVLLALPAAAFDAAKLGLSGNLESQTLVRHAEIDDFQFIQNRNTVRLRADWDWLDQGRLLGLVGVPFLKEWKTVLLYRGVYDSVYDIKPGDRQHGQERLDDLVGGRISDFSNDRLNDLKFENDLREAYVDLRFSEVPLFLRLGRQQVVWGESDYFRLMDFWNPIDIRWHLQQEQSWDEIRVPLWLLKAVWEFGEVGPVSDTYAELVYNPGDYHPGIVVDFLPRPWALPFPSPLRPGQVQFDPVTKLTLSSQFDLQGTSVRRGDFHRNPEDASEIGTRVHATLPGGVEVTANYLYGRGRAVGAASPFAVRIRSIDLPQSAPVGRYQTDSRDPTSVVTVFPIDVVAEVVHPYLHIFGLTAKYFDAALTQTSFRLESAYVIGAPFQTIEPNKLAKVTLQGKPLPPDSMLDLGTAPLGYTERDQWSGMLGFDRATWIPAINKNAPWVFSGQFFWTYTLGNHIDDLRGNAGVSEEPYFGPTGVWVDGPYAGQVEREQNARVPGNGDNIRRFESLLTLAATSFYDNGRFLPTIAVVTDPVNKNMQILWSFDYFVANSFFVTLQQRYFTDFDANRPSNDPWFAGGRNHRRDETGVKLTFQF